MKSPETTLPRSGMIGMLGVSVSYILSNVAYLLLFPLQKIVSTNTIAMVSNEYFTVRHWELVISWYFKVYTGSFLVIPCISKFEYKN